MFINGLSPTALTGIIALIILILASEQAVKRVLKVVEHFGLSKTFAGLTIFSIATSFPEIFAHLTGSIEILTGKLDYKIGSATVLGANIGSDVVQQTFVLGLVVLLMGGLKFKKQFLKHAYLPMIGTTIMCIILGIDGTYSRLDGMILFGTFIAYLWWLYTLELNERFKRHKSEDTHLLMDSAIAIVCMAAMLASAHYLLQATQRIVELTGLGGSLIGVLTLGVASATPELFTAISGIRQKSTGISVGTLIGSNITNPLAAIGGGAIISTYWVPKALIQWDLAMETITAALLLIYLMKTKGKLGKAGAIYLILLYFFYITIRIAYFPTD